MSAFFAASVVVSFPSSTPYLSHIYLDPSSGTWKNLDREGKAPDSRSGAGAKVVRRKKNTLTVRARARRRKVRERENILALVSECETSAQRKLRSLGNPPKIGMAFILMPEAWECYEVLRCAEKIRRAIRDSNAPAAGLAAFRLGQTVYRAALRRSLKLPKKRGRPKGKLKQRTAKRIRLAVRLKLAGKTQRAMASQLFHDSSHPYQDTRQFFSRYGAKIKSQLRESKSRLRTSEDTSQKNS
jgi:hypothetical protein